MGETNKIKLIAIDMDGTLLNCAGRIPEENRKAIKEAERHGIHVVISTGRSKWTSQDLVQTLGLKTYVITVNGSEIWDEHGNIVERRLLDTAHVNEMLTLKEKYKEHARVAWWATSVCKVWRDELPRDVSSYEWLKFGFHIHDDTVRETIRELLVNNPALEITNSSPTNLEINAAGVNKAMAIEKVCQLLGITMENVMAIGDSFNDLAMIQAARIGVAMGNAQPFIKDASDWVTSTNDENGVAKAIRTWALPDKQGS